MNVAQEKKSLQRFVALLYFTGLLLDGLCQKISGPTDSPDQLQFVVDGVESGQAIDLIQNGHVVIIGRWRIGRGSCQMVRTVVWNAFRSLVSLVAAPASVPVPFAIAGRQTVGLLLFSSFLSSRAVIVDQVLFTHSPRTVNVPRTRPVISKFR